jgi:glutathione S-transferase
MANSASFLTSGLTTSLRGLSGITAEPATVKPERLLQIYDIEGCPYCRLVREALTELDLDAIIYPCPKDGQRYRSEVMKRGGKQQFPFMIDPNTGVEMYESIDIIEYFYKTYGQRELPMKWRLGGLQKMGSMLASVPRMNHGLRRAEAPRASGDTEQQELLELYSFEASPYARPVRETLCELEIPYILRSCGRNRLAEWLLPSIRESFGVKTDSVLHNRVKLEALEGSVQIPYLQDPNTDTSMFESADIVAYLLQRYAA